MASMAFDDFKESLSIAEELLRIERTNYHIVPKLDEQRAVQGLRGGVSVLVVASFERYLRDAIDENLTPLSNDATLRLLSKMPDKVRVKSIFATLERALTGPQFVKARAKIERIPDINRACAHVLTDKINPKAFNDTGSNPSSSTVHRLMKDMDIPSFFPNIKVKFEKKWRTPVATTFIPDKLDEIVNRRHRVAHTADALNITRNQLRESIRFLKILGEIIDKELKTKMRQLKKISAVEC